MAKIIILYFMASVCAMCIILISLLVLLPVFFSAGSKMKARTHERRIVIVCQGNMQLIASALETYRDRHGAFPPAYSTDEQGNVLHSWRVLILPYLREIIPSYSRSLDEILTELCNGIRLDEPWDSEWNSQFHKRIPFIFQCSLMQPAGRSSFFMIIDENSQIVPESGILFAEKANPASNWMDPNHEILLADTTEGVNANPDGISSRHEIKKYFGIFGRDERGANVCTFDFEIIWVPEGWSPEFP